MTTFTATKDILFVHITEQREINKILAKTPTYKSKSSVYWKTEKGIYRMSNHWNLLKKRGFKLLDEFGEQLPNGIIALGFAPTCSKTNGYDCYCDNCCHWEHPNFKKIKVNNAKKIKEWLNSLTEPQKKYIQSLPKNHLNYEMNYGKYHI